MSLGKNIAIVAGVWVGLNVVAFVYLSIKEKKRVAKRDFKQRFAQGWDRAFDAYATILSGTTTTSSASSTEARKIAMATKNEIIRLAHEKIDSGTTRISIGDDFVVAELNKMNKLVNQLGLPSF